MKQCGIKVFVLLLIPGLSGGVQALQQSVIEQNARLVKLIDVYAVEEFKRELSRTRGEGTEVCKDIVADAADYIKILRGQKIAQLAHNIGRSQKIAGAKAAFCGLLFCSAVIAQIGLSAQWISDLHTLFHAQTDKKGDPLKVVGYFHYVCMPSLAYLSMSWANENARFALYGDTILISDIRKLDEMLVYAQSIV